MWLALWFADMSSIGRQVTRSVYVMVLRKGLPSPFAPESDEEKSETPKPAAAAGATVAAPVKPDTFRIDIDGIGQRILALPVPGVPMQDLKAVTRELLASGAPIQDMNTVRKHLSVIQGGKLALATKARVLALVISDVTGDDPTHIASGPTVPDPTTYADAIEILERFAVTAPPSIAAHLARGASGAIAETPKPGDPAFARVDNRVIATAHASLTAAADYMREHAVTPLVLGDSVTGESAEVAKVYAALAREVRLHDLPIKPPVALISGGETTVTLRKSGRGGRCSEFLLSLAVSLEGLADTWALACDTDGIDGSEDNAGAILTPDALARARAAGLAPKRMLADNDSYGFFAALGDLVVTGPTRTNVNDYRIIMVR